jgi:hypothetical protein
VVVSRGGFCRAHDKQGEESDRGTYTEHGSMKYGAYHIIEHRAWSTEHGTRSTKHGILTDDRDRIRILIPCFSTHVQQLRGLGEEEDGSNNNELTAKASQFNAQQMQRRGRLDYWLENVRTREILSRVPIIRARRKVFLP